MYEVTNEARSALVAVVTTVFMKFSSFRLSCMFVRRILVAYSQEMRVLLDVFSYLLRIHYRLRELRHVQQTLGISIHEYKIKTEPLEIWHVLYSRRSVAAVRRTACTADSDRLTTPELNMTVVWGVAPCSLVEIDRLFRGSYHLHHPDCQFLPDHTAQLPRMQSSSYSVL